MTTSYDIRVIGHLWQPGIVAAQHFRFDDNKIKTLRDAPDAIVTAGDLFIDAETPTQEDELAAIDRWLATNTGDFSSIDAVEIIRIERYVLDQSVTTHGNVTRTHHETSTVETTLRSFSEDDELTYTDAMYEAES